jgi:hypothetical protein
LIFCQLKTVFIGKSRRFHLSMYISGYRKIFGFSEKIRK